MECGDTFLMPAPGGQVTPHLWIVITQPDPQTHECAIVSVTTLRNSKDQTVILRVGDHCFIRHDSTIFYGDAMLWSASARSRDRCGTGAGSGEVPARDSETDPRRRGSI